MRIQHLFHFRAAPQTRRALAGTFLIGSLSLTSAAVAGGGPQAWLDALSTVTGYRFQADAVRGGGGGAMRFEGLSVVGGSARTSAPGFLEAPLLEVEGVPVLPDQDAGDADDARDAGDGHGEPAAPGNAAGKVLPGKAMAGSSSTVAAEGATLDLTGAGLNALAGLLGFGEKPSPARRWELRDAAVTLGLPGGVLDLSQVNFTANTAPGPVHRTLVGSLRGQAGASPRASLSAEGRMTVGTGPSGGHGIDGDWSLQAFPVEELRTLFPGRIDPSFSGLVRVRGTAKGIVGETSNEERPAESFAYDAVGSVDWSLFGLSAPLEFDLEGSVDDRSVRFRNGMLRWRAQELALRGWFDPKPGGRFSVKMPFEAVIPANVAAEWSVEPRWIPDGALNGVVLFAGTAGKGLLKYEAETPVLRWPGPEWLRAEGSPWAVELEGADLGGTLGAVNALVSLSVRGDLLRLAGIEVENPNFGLRFFRGRLTGTMLDAPWAGGKMDLSVGYSPWDEHKLEAGVELHRVDPDEVAAFVGVLPEGVVDGTLYVHAGMGRTNWEPWLHGRAGVRDGEIRGFDLVADVHRMLSPVLPGGGWTSVGSVPMNDAPSGEKATSGAGGRGGDPDSGRRDSGQRKSGPATHVDDLRFDFLRDFEAGDGSIRIEALDLRSGRLELQAAGRVSAAGALQLKGVVRLDRAWTKVLALRARWLDAMTDDSGRFSMAVEVGGTIARPELILGIGFLERLKLAAAGQQVHPLVPEPLEPLELRNVRPLPGAGVRG